MKMERIIRTISLVLLSGVFSTVSLAQELSPDEMRSLDGQVQDIKSDVLAIAAELGGLEERLLFPSSTQLSLFVALEPSDPFRLDAVQVALDGELVAHYIYSFKELEALQEGGVQRLYTGNVATGSHSLTVSVTGKSENGREFSDEQSFSFAKGVEPHLIGLMLAGSGSGGSAIRIANW